jgi:hypothetical protein
MAWIMVDIEADGPVPSIYSMISIGAVSCDDKKKTFYGKLKPISDLWVPEALAKSGHTREETMTFDDPKKVMQDFDVWLQSTGKDRPMFISDNNGFDWMFVCWYFWKFTSACPFGHSSTNLGSLFKGMKRNMRENFQEFKRSQNVTRHTHHPVDDATGNVEVFDIMKTKMRLKP